MNVALPIGNTILMGSDNGGGWTPKYIHGNNFAVFISVESKNEADRIFYQLSKNEIITVPINYAFWGDYFGKLTNKFGVNWMISCNEK